MRWFFVSQSEITLATDLESRATLQNCLPPSALAARLKPAPTGSIITRSVNCSQVSGLSCNCVVLASCCPELKSAMRGPDESEMQIG